MRNALRASVILLFAFLASPLLTTGQVTDSGGSAATPLGQAMSATLQEHPVGPSNVKSAGEFVLQDATPVRLRLNRTVSSADSHVGDTVDFEVLQEVQVNGTPVIPKGTLVFGTVTEAEPTKRMARGGKLEIKVVSVKLVDGKEVALRALEGGKGGSHVVAMTTGMVATGLIFFPVAPSFLLMHGKDIVIPKAAEVTAYVNGDVKLDMTRFQQFLPETVVVEGTGLPKAGSTPPPGSFFDHTYTNEYFTLSYRLPPEWVLETDLIRRKLASGKHSSPGNVVLAAVHIPQDLTELRADSSLQVLAEARSAKANTKDCKQYLDAMTARLDDGKRARRKGEVTEYSVAGHEFSRANFEYRSEVSDHAEICSPTNGYLLLWRIEGSTWDSVDEAASTIYTVAPWLSEKQPEPQENHRLIRISGNTASGLLLRRVQPVYPAEARANHIRGKVRMQVVISKAGDVGDLELLDGPIELAVPAVTAIRQWKYRPYLVSGKPVAVRTEIVVTYS